VKPLAATASRMLIWDLKEHQVLRRIAGGMGDDLQAINGRTFIFRSTGEAGKTRGHLFVHDPSADGGSRVIMADDWMIDREYRDRSYAAKLREVVNYDIGNIGSGGTRFAAAAADPPPAAPPKFMVLRAPEIQVPVDVDALVGRFGGEDRQQEMTLPAIVSAFLEEEPDERAARRAGEMAGRALLCPIAALLALTGIALARPGLGRHLALPLAATATLGFDVAVRIGLVQAAQAGGVELLAAGSALLGVCVLVLMIRFGWRAERLVAPTFGRT